MKLILLAGIIAFDNVFAIRRFDNYSVYDMVPSTLEEINFLKCLKETNNYDFWMPAGRIGNHVNIMVAPEQKEELNDLLAKNNIPYQIRIKNVQELQDKQKPKNHLRSNNLDFKWDRYHTLDEIYNWIKEIASSNSDKVTLVNVGTSYEGRDILGLKLSFKPGNQNRSVWLDSLMHSREWISGATLTYILDQILFSTDPSIRNIAERHDWYFFPVLNPDGYIYSHTTDRMWRKNRKPYEDCFGADLNRNWGYKWDDQSKLKKGPCSEEYPGDKPFSEIETSSLSKFLSSVANDLIVYINIHAYSQMILIPYGDTKEHLDNYNITYAIGLKAAESLAKRYGTQYEVGNTAETIYPVVGTVIDWLKGNYHVPFVYSFELRDNGEYAFLLPSEQILPTAEETLDAVLTILQEAYNII